MKKVSMIIPCYNEEGNVKLFYSEAVKAYNCDTSQGSLATFNNPSIVYTMDNEISSLTAYYGESDSTMLIANGNSLSKPDKTKVYDISGAKLDYLNFEYNGNRILIGASSEDTPFLYDGNKQLKIKYNPKVSSLKINLLESKIDTIGSRYPYIFRNGNVYYREFPISGLISCLMDEENLFIDEK